MSLSVTLSDLERRDLSGLIFFRRIFAHIMLVPQLTVTASRFGTMIHVERGGRVYGSGTLRFLICGTPYVPTYRFF